MTVSLKQDKTSELSSGKKTQGNVNLLISKCSYTIQKLLRPIIKLLIFKKLKTKDFTFPSVSFQLQTHLRIIQALFKAEC